MAESPKEAEKELKLKAKMVNTDEINYTFQVYPVNVDWTYSEPESAYRIHELKFKNDSMRQIVRNVLLKYKETFCDSIRVGSKEYIFEVQISKGIETDKLREIFTQIANEIKADLSRSKSKVESVQKFLEETEF
jgi:hypothetical protein